MRFWKDIYQILKSYKNIDRYFEAKIITFMRIKENIG